jgi:glycosyltransferase involved in cell wall biosynthesis
MKILVVAPQPFYVERGTPIAVKLLVETLCEFGHEVDLLVYHSGQDVAIPGMRLIRAGRPPGITKVPIGISPQKLICDLWLIAAMIRLTRRTRYDVIHANEEAVFPAAVLRYFLRNKLVYDMDSSLADQLTDKWRLLRPFKKLFEMVERGAVVRSAAVFAVCEDLAVKVRRWIDPSRVLVLPDVPMASPAVAVEVESLRTQVRPGAVIAMYVGNLERYQGIDLLVDGLAQVPASVPLHTFIIGGDAAHVESYRKRVQELGIADRVQFMGPRPVAALNGYLAQAEILLSPRILGTNTPMKVYSYMQSGKVILATDIRSHTQALDSSCAQLVKPEPQALARGIEQLANDPALRQSLGDAARDKAEREYSLPVFRQKLRHAYDTILADR